MPSNPSGIKNSIDNTLSTILRSHKIDMAKQQLSVMLLFGRVLKNLQGQILSVQ